MTSNTKISNLIESQVPFFVRNDHANFVRFIEAYYEYLEQEGKVAQRAMKLPEYNDIDTSIDLFVQQFYKDYLPLLPQDTAADKTLVLKHVKDFYRARGSEKSIRFLMRVLFNEEADFYYPQRDILRASDGKWFIEKSIKIFDVKVDGVSNTSLDLISKFNGKKITGLSSNNFAVVETAESYYEGGVLVQELKISNQYKQFDAGETISAVFTENGNERTITANLYSGVISSVRLTNPGKGYQVGDVVTLESNTGEGGLIIVSSVGTGNIKSLGVLVGGAGFQVNNPILISGGGGSGATAIVSDVADDNTVHPSSYDLYLTPISAYLNVAINTANYGIVGFSNANTTIANSLAVWQYSNTGPISNLTLTAAGTGYVTIPTVRASANTRIKNLGILGRLRVEDGGLGYSVGDKIYFDNRIGTFGYGGKANVTNVAANGMIRTLEFEAIAPYPPGGIGYVSGNLPVANLSLASGTGANVQVVCLLGEGETLLSESQTAGEILELSILSRGSGYSSNLTLNLQSIGDGTARANATVIQGTFTYPGRYINDDGHLSSYNFIQDRDYYQPFSYVIKVRQSIEKYRKALKELIHPLGMKVFGEFGLVDDESVNVAINATSSVVRSNTYFGSFDSAGNGNNSIVTISTNREMSNGNVYIEFATSNSALLNTGSYNKIYLGNVVSENVSFSVTLANSINANGTVYFTRI